VAKITEEDEMKFNQLLAVGALAFGLSAQASNTGVLVQGHNKFGVEVMSSLLEAEGEKNIFFSPTSLNLALEMLHVGSAGHTMASFHNVYNLPRLRTFEIASLTKSYIEELRKNDEGLTLNIANAVWANKDFPLKKNYVETIEKDFGATAKNVDFKSDALNVAADINQWAADNTNNRIKKVVDADLVVGLEMLLANATYFKGTWKVEFDKKATYKGDFAVNGLEKIQTDKMFQTNRLAYAEPAGGQLVELPFKGETSSMIIALPPRGVEAANWVKNEVLAGGALLKADEVLKVEKVRLSLPKFKFKYERFLNNDLADLGLANLFGNPNFSLMSDVPLRVGFVKQNTFVQVDEKGAEAAAVTTIGIERTSVNIERTYAMDIDRPFFVAIKDKTTDTILFMGLINNPVWE
jgi:serpin B